MKRRALIKLNTKFFMDTHFLREGAFTNVPSGSSFYADNTDISTLLPDTESTSLEDGRVWQSPFRSWVYESGIPLDGTVVTQPPYQYSGVFIQGSLRTPEDEEFGHVPDYINGRIIFNDSQPLDLDVHAQYAWRHVRIGFEHDFNQQAHNGVLETKYVSNPLTNGQINYPSGNIYPFPSVFIEVDGRQHEGYELGNRSVINTDDVIFHVWALDDLQRDDIIDIIDQQVYKVLPIIDWNKVPMPLSGIYNTLSPEYVPYQDILTNRELITTVGSGLPIQYYAHFDGSSPRNIPGTEEYERGQVEVKLTWYLNAPTGPLGHLFGPISVLPSIGSTTL